jgi:LmbE family N-acetylglucosaminyl deacetylase
MRMRVLILLSLVPICLTAQERQPVSPSPDDRYKADILVVVAHPDDELLVATFLAKASLDEHKRIAVVYGTRGNGGENNVGYEQSASLAAIREMEARHALATLGISNVWFLSAPDTPPRNGHNVLRSLETWNHGSTLGEVVRLMRLTRPAVVLTFLPDVVVGENHEDHQAAGVIATEAFDIAGDPTQFPEQVTFPEDHTNFGVLVEGLRPWQPQKLYYYSDADDQAFLKGKGPIYPPSEVSPSLHTSYSRLWLRVASVYKTQYGEISAADSDFVPPPVSLILGKSLVGGTTAADVLEDTGTESLPFAAITGYRSSYREGASVELGGPWHFYRQFWQAHNLEHLERLLPTPEIGVVGGSTLFIPVLIHNNTNHTDDVTLRIGLPEGWKEKKGTAVYPTSAHDVYPVGTVLIAPEFKKDAWQEIQFSIEVGGRGADSTTLRVKVGGSD